MWSRKEKFNHCNSNSHQKEIINITYSGCLLNENIYLNTDGFAWTLETEWNTVCLSLNQASMEHEHWLTTIEDISKIIHASSRRIPVGRWGRGRRQDDPLQTVFREDGCPTCSTVKFFLLQNFLKLVWVSIKQG